MRRLLIVNPNTSASVSALLARHARAFAAQAVSSPVAVDVIAARFGAPYIACEASYAVAGHAALDAWAAHHTAVRQREVSADAPALAPPDALLIGCFGDPALHALREVAGLPVTGLAEAAFTEAAQLGRYAIVTGGERWVPMLQRLAAGLGLADPLRGIHTVAPSGAQLAADRPAAVALLTQACRAAIAQARERDGPDALQALILGGAGLAGLAAEIQPALDLPLIDSVAAGVRQALALADLGLGHRSASGFHTAWGGVSAEMLALQAAGA